MKLHTFLFSLFVYHEELVIWEELTGLKNEQYPAATLFTLALEMQKMD